MTHHASVKKGALVLDQPLDLPEGTRVEVEVRPAPSPAETEPVPTLLEQMSDLVGRAEGLPSDLARNHDHYLYGRERK